MSYSENPSVSKPQNDLRKEHQERHKPNDSEPSSFKSRPCRDGLDCILYDSITHCSKYSHPCRFAHRCNKKTTEPNFTHEPNPTQQCRYDEQCRKINDPLHRASYWHSNKSDYLRACRDHVRCSDNSFEHRSQYAHGEYKSIFNSKPLPVHSQHNNDHQHIHKKDSHKQSTDKSSKTIDRARNTSSNHSPPDRTQLQRKEKIQSPDRSTSQEKASVHKKPGNKENTTSGRRSQSRGRSNSKGRSQSRKRSQSREKLKSERKPSNKEKSSSGRRSQSRDRSISKGRSQSRGRSNSKGRSKSQEKSKIQGKLDNRDKKGTDERSQDRSRSKSREKSKTQRKLGNQDKLHSERGARSRSRSQSRTKSDGSTSQDSTKVLSSVPENTPKSILRPSRRSRSRDSAGNEFKNNAARGRFSRSRSESK
ncbi:hypothetical protein I4U23_003802 [Adineta vaga]|nr:hypothetical protein I4U23_003802 [Adineta vaga]